MCACVCVCVCVVCGVRSICVRVLQSARKCHACVCASEPVWVCAHAGVCARALSFERAGYVRAGLTQEAKGAGEGGEGVCVCVCVCVAVVVVMQGGGGGGGGF